MLPEHPLLHGVASLTSWMSATSRRQNAELLGVIRNGFQKEDRFAVQYAWRHVGETLHWAIDQIEAESSESGY